MRGFWDFFFSLFFFCSKSRSVWDWGTDCGGAGHGAAVRGGGGDGGGDGGGGRRGGSPYSQILRGEAAQARQAAPGGRTVELLHLLRQLLLQTPLLLVLLRVGELHHDGGRAALQDDGEKKERRGGSKSDVFCFTCMWKRVKYLTRAGRKNSQ